MVAARVFQGSYSDRIQRLRQAFVRGRLPRVMTSPPTVTQSTTGISGTTKVASPSNFSAATGKFRYVGGAPYKLPFDGTDWVQLTNVSYSADGATAAQVGGSVEFCTEAPIFEINLGGNGTPIRLWCEEDGEMRLVSAALYHTSSTNSHFIVDFTGQTTIPTARRFRVDFGMGGAASFFFGVVTSVLYDVWRPYVGNPLRCIVAGDSFTEGTTGDGTPTDIGGLSGFANYMGWGLGLDDVWCSGSGGTGWVQTSGSRVGLIDRFQLDVIARAPDLAVVAMGVNDSAIADATLQAAVSACVTNFRTALPTVPLAIVVPWAPQGSSPSHTRAAIIAGAQTDASGRTVIIDPKVTGAEWQWPAAGRQGATTGVGNGDWAIDSGGTHPTVAGHAYLGQRLANAIKGALAA